MGLFDQFPYTNFHNLNLDWIIGQIKNIKNAVTSTAEDAASASESAEAAAASAGSAAESAETAGNAAALVDQVREDLDTVNTEMTNFVQAHSGLYNETVLWSGTASTQGDTIELSDDIRNYEYIDVQATYKGATSSSSSLGTFPSNVVRFTPEVFTEDNAVLNIPYAYEDQLQICTVFMFWDSLDPTDYTKITLGYTRRVSINDHGDLDNAADPGTVIVKIVGVKNIADAEVIDARVGDDDTVYSTLKQRLDSEYSELKSAIGSTGLSQMEKNLIMTLFRAIPFTGDVHEAFNSLDSIWKGQTPTSFSITKSLTGCSIDNQTSTVSAGEEFIATITENTGYDLDSITVTMGGTNISASAVSNNVISIHSVNGNVVITAVATKANYTPVEYIVQSADGAYIDTGYYPKLTDTVECEFSLGVIDWSYIFSANRMTNIVYKFVTRGDNTAGRTTLTRRAGAFNANATADANFKAQLNTVYKFVETAPGVASLYDSSDAIVASLSDENTSSLVSEDAKIFLFIQASSNGVIESTSKTGLIQLRDFKIKNNLGNVIHHYIPVKDENDVACMYDTIDKQYLYDGSGNNNFSAGNEVMA